MGIKNIHLTLISASILISIIFGFWSLNNHFQSLGFCSLASAVVLIVYGLGFIKRMKTL